MSRKIHFFVANTFQKRDCERFGIDLLKSNGFEVLIWDLTTLVAPANYRVAKDAAPYVAPNYKVLTTVQESAALLASLPEADCIVFLVDFDQKTLPLFQALSQSAALRGAIQLGSIPAPLIEKRSFLKRASSAILHPSKIFRKLKRASKLSTEGIRPYDFLIVGGVRSQDSVPSLLTDEHTKILWCHNMDYDIFMRNPVQETPSTHIVFLDVYYPFHPDFSYNGESFPATPEQYYGPLRCLFDTLESKTGKKVIIAAHPRSEYYLHPDYYGGREVIKGKTAQLVRSAAFVVCDVSTSINFVVLYKKPLLMVSHSFFRGSTSGGYTNAIAAAFRKKVIYLDEKYGDLDLDRALYVDSAVYQQYKNDYIKKDNTPDIQTWQIFANFLLELQSKVDNHFLKVDSNE